MAKNIIKAVGLSLALASLMPVAQASGVPEGVKLAAVQELVKGNGSEPASLDPQKVEGTTGSAITKDLFEGLVQQDDYGNTIPAQATHWDISEDNRTFTFHLREGILWSDGHPVTAEDFVFAFRRAVDPETASRYAWYQEIATVANAADIIRGKKAPEELGVRAVNDRTFEVTLEQPVPYFVKMLAHQNTYPVPKHVVTSLGDRWTRPGNMVSNGAYVLEHWVVNERIVLKRNPKYWDNDNTTINKVTYMAIESANTELARYKAGELDMTASVPLEHFRSLQRDLPNDIRITPYLGAYYYEFNTKVPPFDDKRVRKALSLAVERDKITTYVLGQGQRPAFTFTPQSVAGYNPPEVEYANWTSEQRLEKAKQLMAEAGYGPDKPLTINLLYNTNENHKKIAIVVSQLWKPLGVRVRLENQEWKTFLDTRNQGRFEMARAGWVGDYNDASTMLDILLSNHGQNKGKWHNEEYDAIMNASRMIADDEERAEYYARAERIIVEEMPIIPVYEQVVTRLVKPHVGGYPMNNVEDTIYTKNMYIIAQ
ncbi:peptide ABC transporter substrate-binding protein [Ferrimonas marina]|uniref:Oligopeptide transport system substrate-binding protein n=1 Tax=Ferrimonas marina TaxID=299255 RepID=A0A1M5X7A0_9GAMM|nr:peptide ABC transporter substrate-binding protein [Ferrimonas marina]SHH95374.1 oligopeptide transport system substrate-binding protein [Ferrimonas marina]